MAQPNEFVEKPFSRGNRTAADFGWRVFSEGGARCGDGTRVALVVSLLAEVCLGFRVPPSDIPIALDLADVVGEAVHHPLRIDLALATQTESFEPGRVIDVGEHWLHRPQAQAVSIAPLVGVDLSLHALGVRFGPLGVAPQDERHLSRRCLIRSAQTLCALFTRLAVALRAPESDHLVGAGVGASSVSVQGLARRALTAACVLGHAEVLVAIAWCGFSFSAGFAAIVLLVPHPMPLS